MIIHELGLRFHHVGHVVENLERARQTYQSLGFHEEGPPTVDEARKVKIQFLDCDGLRVELIESVRSDSPVARFAGRGGGLAHLCYAVANLAASAELLRNRGFVPAGLTAPAVALEDRLVAFFVSADGQVIELLQD